MGKTSNYNLAHSARCSQLIAGIAEPAGFELKGRRHALQQRSPSCACGLQDKSPNMHSEKGPPQIPKYIFCKTSFLAGQANWFQVEILARDMVRIMWSHLATHNQKSDIDARVPQALWKRPR